MLTIVSSRFVGVVTQAEIHPRKRQWIQDICKVPVIFGDVCRLPVEGAVNFADPALPLVAVPSPMLWVCGFSCTSISGLNTDCKSHRSVGLSGSGEPGISTSATWAGSSDFVCTSTACC